MAQLATVGQTLVFTKYFMSRISDPVNKERRQSTFLEALETFNDFPTYYVHSQANPQLQSSPHKRGETR